MATNQDGKAIICEQISANIQKGSELIQKGNGLWRSFPQTTCQ
jgi:hypothetical protein